MTLAGKVTSYKKDDFLFCFFSFVERSKGIGDRVYCESYFYDEKITGKRFHNFLQSAGNVKIFGCTPNRYSSGKVSPLQKFRSGETFFVHVFQVVLFHHCGATGTESKEVSPLWRTSHRFYDSPIIARYIVFRCELVICYYFNFLKDH